MSLRLFAALAAASFVAVDLAAGAAARVAIAGEAASSALAGQIRDQLDNPLGAFFLFLPFALTGFICAAVADKAGRRPAVLIFAAAVAAFAGLWWIGYRGEQLALLEHEWTAAALSIGFLPFVSLPVVGAAFLLGLYAIRGRPGR
jgi:hypothetical protein